MVSTFPRHWCEWIVPPSLQLSFSVWHAAGLGGGVGHASRIDLAFPVRFENSGTCLRIALCGDCLWAGVLSFLLAIRCPFPVPTISRSPGGKHPCSGLLPSGENMGVRGMHSMAPGKLTVSSSSFYPFWVSRHFSIELPLCLLGHSFPFTPIALLSALKEFFI